MFVVVFGGGTCYAFWVFMFFRGVSVFVSVFSKATVCVALLMWFCCVCIFVLLYCVMCFVALLYLVCVFVVLVVFVFRNVCCCLFENCVCVCLCLCFCRGCVCCVFVNFVAFVICLRLLLRVLLCYYV